MIRHTLKTLYHMLQDFWSVSDHFGTLCLKRLHSLNHSVITKVTHQKILEDFTIWLETATRKKYPYSEGPYSILVRENTDLQIFKYRQFLCSNQLEIIVSSCVFYRKFSQSRIQRIYFFQYHWLNATGPAFTC